MTDRIKIDLWDMAKQCVGIFLLILFVGVPAGLLLIYLIYWMLLNMPTP